MNIQKLFLVASVVLWGGHAAAQSRLFDGVAVDFPNDVNIAGKVLHAGTYEIRQLRNSASGARVLFVTGKSGTGFEAEAATIPVLDNLTPTRTHVVLRRSGGIDYVRQVWIAGKNYGYEFRVADQGQLSASGGNEVTLTATYTPETPAVVAQNQPEPAREATPAQAETAPAPAAPAQQEQAQASPPAAPPQQSDAQSSTAAASSQRAPTESAATASPSAGNEDSQRTTQTAPTDRLPTTAMNWMVYLIAGILTLAMAAVLNFVRTRSQN